MINTWLYIYCICWIHQYHLKLRQNKGMLQRLLMWDKQLNSKIVYNSNIGQKHKSHSFLSMNVKSYTFVSLFKKESWGCNSVVLVDGAICCTSMTMITSTWWYMIIIQALNLGRLEDHRFKATLNYVRPCLK